MAIERFQCPQCRTAVNVPAGMVSVKCPKCGHIWKLSKEDDETETGSEAADPAQKKPRRRSRLTAATIAAVAGGLILVAAVAGGLWWWFDQPPAPAVLEFAPSAAQPAPSAVAETYREIDLPENQRRQIYSDYRTAAKATVGKAVPLPRESAARQGLDAMMAATLQREIRRFAALHDVTESEIEEVLKEGNAKQWK